jgi:AbrB family looped-hinge helix DNA binding protein
MTLTTLTSKGQMTLPKDVREDLGLVPGDRIDVVKEGGKYVLNPKTKSAMEFAGILHRDGRKAVSIEEMNEAIGKHLAEDDERIRAGR